MASIKRLEGFDKPTVWQIFGNLTVQHKAISLGQGAPDWQPLDWIKNHLRDASEAVAHQYARAIGDLELCQALAESNSQSFNRTINELTEVMITNGATEALFCAIMSLISNDDEVILFEPAFDLYPAHVQMAGGKSVFVPIEYNGNGNWVFDINTLEKAVTSKTKAILFNSPMNPNGKMLSLSELESIAELLQRHPNIIAICDEVYEYIYYSDKKHRRLASLPGMFDRVITISSGIIYYDFIHYLVLTINSQLLKHFQLLAGRLGGLFLRRL